MSLLNLEQYRDVLGLNARTLEYARRLPSSRGAKLANSKLNTKRVLQKAGIPTPLLYSKISSRQQLRRFRWTKLPPSYVLKPNRSSGGGGIIVVFGRNKKGNWVKADKSELFIPELKNHILDILDGSFTKSGISDVAFFEQRIKLHSAFKPYSVKGVPDIRVLVHNLVPVMAMVRFPTASTSGRANLHAGGIGVGINIIHGYTTTAVQHGQVIEMLPDTRLELSGIRIPHWNEVLLLASRATRAAGLDFAGVDIAIDRDDGPLVLELNARPGLDIQFANMTPLRGRLKRVEGLDIKGPAKGVQVAKSLFGDEIDSEIEDISGRTVLGVEEKIKIVDSQGQSHPVLAKIDTGAYRTAIDEGLAKKYGLSTPIVDHKSVRAALGSETRPVIGASLLIRDRLVKTKAFLTDRSHMSYDIIVGRRDLKGFLVDPSRAKRLLKDKTNTEGA